jgi:CheY-like chemotaxis protein
MFEDHAPTLVVVEDDPGHARLIERNLRRAHLPYSLVLLGDGQAALDYL